MRKNNKERREKARREKEEEKEEKKGAMSAMAAKGVLARVDNIEKTIIVLVLAKQCIHGVTVKCWGKKKNEVVCKFKADGRQRKTN